MGGKRRTDLERQFAKLIATPDAQCSDADCGRRYWSHEGPPGNLALCTRCLAEALHVRPWRVRQVREYVAYLEQTLMPDIAEYRGKDSGFYRDFSDAVRHLRWLAGRMGIDL